MLTKGIYDKHLLIFKSKLVQALS